MNATHVWFALLTAVSTSCVPTDSGNPPAALDGSRLSGVVTIGVSENMITLRGAPSSVSPAGATVHALNLDSTAEVSSVVSAGDGSFDELVLLGTPSDRIRVWSGNVDAPSTPVDARVGEEGLTIPNEHLPACLVVQPNAHLRMIPGADGVVTLTNACDGVIELSGVRLRDPAGPYALVGVAPTQIALGASVDVPVRAASVDALPVDALVIESSAPEVGWAAITLLPAAP